MTMDEMYRRARAAAQRVQRAALKLSGGHAAVRGRGERQLANTDVSGNTWNAFQANLDRYNAQQAQSNAIMSGLFGLGSAGIGAWGMRG